MLKPNDFGTLLIGAEGARSSKMHLHLFRAVLIQGCLIKVLRECGIKGRPRMRKALRGIGSPEVR
ncbi:hypothetical protein DFO73_103110 [Cytobacillus oceanisediminis]|uniref:Uncharacterized protein n=1 Tax=Cytobacillus oceanisediminis TaxID=665099 RepID=A0A2V3A0T5_9BACI|nr:hypothetical protein DFO73_103110 [Cytobacillus oceanisediminis]